MKVPVPPPDLDEILREIDPQRFLHIVSLPANAMSEEYYSWDKLRHLSPPDGLSVDEWWLATRLARRQVQRAIPVLVDTNAVPFSYTLPDELLRLSDEVTRTASGRIRISEQVTDAGTRDRYVISSLIEEAITS